MPIDFELSEEQRQLQINARQFAEQVLAPVAETIDRSPDAWTAFTASREAFREFGRAGFTKVFIPTEFGGAGLSLLDLAIATEELARFDVNVPTTLLGNGLALYPIIHYGTPEQRERFLRPFSDDTEGELLGALAFTEVEGGANFDSADPKGGIQTIARLEGDEWVITGEKHYTTNGTGWNRTGCHLYTVVCRIDDALPANEGLAVIVVEGDRPGIVVGDVYDKLGHRGVISPRIEFDHVRVPVDNLIGQPGVQAKAIFIEAFSWTGALIGAASVGTMRAAFEHALDFGRTEKRLGTAPVIDHQNFGFMLADAKMRIEASRYLTWKACHQFDRTGGRDQELAIAAKIHCSEAATSVVWDCMRLVGIASYTKNFSPLERIMRDTMAFPLYDGGNLGIRRRQLHDLFREADYDPLGAAFGVEKAAIDGGR